MKRYKVQRYFDDDLGWRDVPFAEHRTMAYCDGYVDCMDSMYPSPPMRIVLADGMRLHEVIRETNGRGKVHTNTANTT